jgi:hypothetical protein
MVKISYKTIVDVRIPVSRYSLLAGVVVVFVVGMLWW